jgi:PAS domain S-box-containing protein
MPKHDLILLALNPSQILSLMERTLRAAGFEVAVAHDEDGLEKSVQEAIPSLVVVGEKFSTTDAFKVTEKLLDRFPTIPIILYADQDTTGLAKAALRAGMFDYIYPPLKMDDIAGAVIRSLGRARQLGDWLRHEVRRTTASLNERAKISEAERSKLEGIFTNIQDGIVVLDESQRILLINHTIQDVFSLDGQGVTGRPLRDVITNADLIAMLSRLSEGPLKYHEVNFDDGRVFNAQYTPIPKIGGAITMQDISYLKEIDRLKNDFVNTVSHDLRSPLTSILGYTELIERTGPLNENQHEFLHRLQGSIHHITNLINELLDLGRLEAGFDTRRESVQLDSVLRYSMDMFDAQAKTKNLRIITKIADDLKPLRANPIRIRQMVDNLVGNAIKYTPKDGRVGINLFMQDDQIIFRVEDSGPGIPPEEHARVFEKFYRASNAPEGILGSGLGLAIVKSIVESHQGRVWVESTVGVGSTFIALLPTQE